MPLFNGTLRFARFYEIHESSASCRSFTVCQESIVKPMEEKARMHFVDSPAVGSSPSLLPPFRNTTFKGGFNNSMQYSPGILLVVEFRLTL